jgi:hypothetical protein
MSDRPSITVWVLVQLAYATPAAHMAIAASMIRAAVIP